MATLTVKTTYSLDPDTIAALADLAHRWGVTRSEALRRAIRLASDGLFGDGDDRLRALDELQASLALAPEALARWAGQVRAERRRSSARAEGRGR